MAFELRNYQSNGIMAPVGSPDARRILELIQKRAMKPDELQPLVGAGFRVAWEWLQAHDSVQEYPGGWVARRGAVRQVYDAFLGDPTTGRAPVQRVLLCAPTGAGKTVMARVITEHAIKAGWTVVFVFDRQALAEQTADTFEGLGKISFLWAGGGEMARRATPRSGKAR